MRNTGLEETQTGIKIAGRNINNLRYADNTTLMAESEELNSLLMQVKEESEKVGLKLNIQKTKIKHKEQILKVAREKQQITHKGIPIRITADLSIETLQARREWQDILKMMKENNLQPRLLYPARISFKYEREIKSIRGFRPGERYLFRVRARQTGKWQKPSIGGFFRNSRGMGYFHGAVSAPFGEPDAQGIREAALIIEIPADIDAASFLATCSVSGLRHGIPAGDSVSFISAEFRKIEYPWNGLKKLEITQKK